MKVSLRREVVREAGITRIVLVQLLVQQPERRRYPAPRGSTANGTQKCGTRIRRSKRAMLAMAGLPLLKS
jgi:hypothetical protein